MAHPTVRAYEAWWQMYRRTWRGSAVTSFLNPVLYLAAMGWGLGHYVSSGGGHDALGGYDYLTYIAPGLLAATAMQVGVGESTWPVLGSIKWWRRYHAMLATPLRVRDVMLGHIGWMLTRVVMTTVVYFGVMVAFGTVPHGYSVLAVPAAVLTGMAFAVPVAAFSATQETDVGFSTLFRFVIVPMFLFSGTFFPIEQLPTGLHQLAWLTPLWHGVDLCRSLDLGTAQAWLTAVHVAYLAALVLVGVALAQRCYARRLQV
ncbi:MAG: ABC transporter permease [Frankiaceae bacterium]